MITLPAQRRVMARRGGGTTGWQDETGWRDDGLETAAATARSAFADYDPSPARRSGNRADLVADASLSALTHNAEDESAQADFVTFKRRVSNPSRYAAGDACSGAPLSCNPARDDETGAGPTRRAWWGETAGRGRAAAHPAREGAEGVTSRRRRCRCWCGWRRAAGAGGAAAGGRRRGRGGLTRLRYRGAALLVLATRAGVRHTSAAASPARRTWRWRTRWRGAFPKTIAVMRLLFKTASATRGGVVGKRFGRQPHGVGEEAGRGSRRVWREPGRGPDHQLARAGPPRPRGRRRRGRRAVLGSSPPHRRHRAR